jgi:Double zinc ribbon
MNCPSCQAALPEDAAFCGRCGGALRSERKCVRCGRSNSPEMRFCIGCGTALSPAAPVQAPRTYTPKHLAEKILTSRSALEGERKQVTVLFADLKGSMDLAEQIGSRLDKELDELFHYSTTFSASQTPTVRSRLRWRREGHLAKASVWVDQRRRARRAPALSDSLTYFSITSALT